MTEEEMQIKLGELAMYARQKGWDDDYTEAVNKVDKCLKELKAQREAWEKAKRTVKAYLMLEGFGSAYQYDIEKLIEECRPKEGDTDGTTK